MLVLQYTKAISNDDQTKPMDEFREVFRSGVVFSGDKQKKDAQGRQTAGPIVCRMALRRIAGRCIALQMRNEWVNGLKMLRSVMGVQSCIEIAHNVVMGWINFG